MGSVRSFATLSDLSRELPRTDSRRYGNDEVIPIRERALNRFRLLLLLGAGFAAIATTLAVRPKSLNVRADDIQTVEIGQFEEHVLASGRIVPLRLTVVTTIVAGRVERTYAHRGDSVIAGTQLLMMENPELAISALESERTALRASQDAVMSIAQARMHEKAAEQRVLEGRAELRDAQQAWAEAEYMLPRELMPAAEGPRRQDRLASAIARVSADSIALQFAKSELSQRLRQAPAEQQLTEILRLRHRDQVAALNVRASVAGILQEFDVTPGEWLNAGQTVAKIMSGEGLGARLEVYEADAAPLITGQPVRILLQNDTMRGAIERIAPAARDGRVMVEVSVNRSVDARLRPELSINAEIIVRETAGAAVLRRPSWVRKPGSFDMLCADATGSSAAVCRIDVTDVGTTSIVVAARHTGLRVITGGTGPPYSSSRYRIH